MTDMEYIDMWKAQTPSVAIGPIKSHIHDNLTLRKKFRRMIYGTHIATIIIAIGMDLQQLITWPWVMTSITIICLLVQIYRIEKNKNNRHVNAALTPLEALKAALRQNKINLRNAWIFSSVIPFSGLIGGLTGGLFARFIISIDSVKDIDPTFDMLLITIPIVLLCIIGLVSSHLYGRKIAKVKKAERAILRKRLTLLEAGL